MARDDFESLVEAVRHVESRGRRYAADAKTLLTSHKGAQGEMQVMPKTQRSPGFGVEPAKPGDPEEIARVGRDYLKAMLDKYGDRDHALAAYNWGPGKVDKWLAQGADPAKLPEETRNYLVKVNKQLGTKTANVPRETPQPQTEAEKVMEPALRAGQTAQAPAPTPAASQQLAELGPNYQAALALSVLADVDEEERKDRDVDDDSQPSVAQKWLAEQGSRPSALASLSDISIKSPFPAPAQMADGGDVKKRLSGLMPSYVRPTAKSLLEELKEAVEKAAEKGRTPAGMGMVLGYEGFKKMTGNRYTPLEDAQRIADRATEKVNEDWDPTGDMEPVSRADGSPEEGESRRALEEIQADARKGEAYRAMEAYLKSRDAVPDIELGYLPYGTYGLYQSSKLPIGSGTVVVSDLLPTSNYRRERAPSALTHEMAHAVDRQMEQQAAEQKGEGNQFTEAYEKLVGSGGRKRVELARKISPEWEKQNRDYRTTPSEMFPHGIGSFSGPTMQDKAPPHVDATAATELAILLDLAQRNVGKKPEGLAKIPAFLRKIVGYSDGGDVELTPEEIEKASKPATVNPMIRRQGEAARKLAAMRDVNTLPDPKTYAAVSSFLGTAPDELGFSVMHPKYQEVQNVAKPAFIAGTAAGFAPAAQLLKGLPVGASIKPVQQFFQHTPTAEAPFVGRLDEFVASMQSPVRKDQFLGQLKGKFREYDIDRAQDALADLDAGAKITPSDLLNRLKRRYDPSTLRTTVHEPRDDIFFPRMDNPYEGSPVGVIHMGSFVPPEQATRIENLKKLHDGFSRIRSISRNSEPEVPELNVLRSDPAAAQALDNIVQARENTITHLRPLIEGEKAMDAYEYPSLSNQFGDVQERLTKEGKIPWQNVYDVAKEEVRQEAKQKLLQMFGEIPNSTSEVKDLLRNKFGDAWIEDGKAMEKQVRDLSDKLYQYVSKQKEGLGLESAYTGKAVHSSLRPPENAVGFSRFVEQTAKGPDGQPMRGIHLLEIQSDLTSELKAGKNPDLKENEVFPRMAENRRTVQQLGIKNAIAAAINRGDQFVTFPGAESAKPKLYESLKDNLKQVAKDLGPGFDIRPMTFRNAQGRDIQHWGIAWGPEAAQRIQKKGVPFKDGGSVDHRKYL